MSHTPTGNTPAGNASSASAKPSLAGVRIKQKKRQAQASAKFDPEGFRDALLLHLALIPEPPTTDALVAKLVTAGAALEFLKYSEQLFELLFIGGLIQPGGSFLDDKRSPVYVLQDETPEWKPVTGMVESLRRVIQRYKYLQKPLEENFLPDVLGYLGKYEPAQRDKLAQAVALLIIDCQISPKCLASLTRDHVVKDKVALGFITTFMKTYLSRQNIDHLGLTLRRSGLKDIALTIPHQTRTKQFLEQHFKAEGLPQVIEWYNKMALTASRSTIIESVKRMLEEEESDLESLRTSQQETGASDADMVEWVWQAILETFDWNARADQVDAAVVALVKANCPLLAAFANGAKAEVGLINAVQVSCYADTRILKTFPQILKVLYNEDVVSDQAIIYWHQKGAKPNGKQHFLKMTEAMVKFLEEESDEE